MLGFKIITKLKLGLKLSRCYCYIPRTAGSSNGVTYNTFMEILYMFRVSPFLSSGGQRRNCIYTASGIVTVCRFSVIKSFVFNIRAAIICLDMFIDCTL